MLALDYEDWILSKGGHMHISGAEWDHKPLSYSHHFIGFDMGQNELEKREQKRQEVKNKLRQ